VVSLILKINGQIKAILNDIEQVSTPNTNLDFMTCVTIHSDNLPTDTVDIETLSCAFAEIDKLNYWIMSHTEFTEMLYKGSIYTAENFWSILTNLF
jgi:hypothetical protein